MVIEDAKLKYQDEISIEIQIAIAVAAYAQSKLSQYMAPLYFILSQRNLVVCVAHKWV